MRDRNGIDLPDSDAAREEARRRAFLLLSEGYRLAEDRGHWTVEVRDDTDNVVLSMSLREAISEII
jgi:hypothetical protein